MGILIKSFLAGFLIFLVVFVSNKYSAFQGGLMNALPIMLTTGYLGVYFSGVDMIEFSRGSLIATIPYVLFTLVLYGTVRKTGRPILSLFVALLLFIPIFMVVERRGR